MPIQIDNTIFNFSGIALSFGIKSILLVIVFVYSIFSILVIRQVKSMEKTIITPFSGLITMVAVLHLAASVALLFAIIFLI